MKILISSHAFAPSIGGIETVSALLAEEFVRLGLEVTVVTQTPDESAEQFPYRVLRQPSLGKLIGAIQWCDIFWQDKPLPRASMHTGHYETITGADSLALALLELHAAIHDVAARIPANTIDR